VISLVSQMLAFAVMVATGFMVGCMFDIYRVIRTLTRPRAKGTFIMDLCFWLWVTPAVFFMLLMGNWGELRLYVFLGAAMGLFAYFQLVSAKVLWALLAFARWLGGLLVRTTQVAALIASMPLQVVRRFCLAWRRQGLWAQQWAKRRRREAPIGKRTSWFPVKRPSDLAAFMHAKLPWGKAWPWPFDRR
jgi:spore cortex biosynthesis protein YabQ